MATMFADAPDLDSGVAAVHSLSTSPGTDTRQPPHDSVSSPHPESNRLNVLVDSQLFVLDRDKLAEICPQFATMFSLPSAPGEQIVPLHNKLEHFKAFVWYLRVHPQAFCTWRESPDTHGKCARLAGIATVAHMYEAHDVAVWAVELALKILEVDNRAFVPEPEMLGDLYSVALKIWMAASESPDRPNTVLYWQRVEAIWMDVLSFTEIDAVPYLLEAQKVNSTPLQAVCYFYTLRRGAGAIAEDARLTPGDRRRLLTGLYSFAVRGQPLAENSWSTPGPPGSSGGQWYPRKDPRMDEPTKLWEAFAVAPWSIES